jgi:hypothetical protein
MLFLVVLVVGHVSQVHHMISSSASRSSIGCGACNIGMRCDGANWSAESLPGWRLLHDERDGGEGSAYRYRWKQVVINV